MKQQPGLRQRQLLFLHLLLVCYLSFAIKPVIAATDHCQAYHDKLDGEFEHLLANRHDTAPSLHEIKLRVLEDHLFEALMQCPQTPSLYALMGELQIVLEQPSLAVAYGNKAIQLDETYWRGYYVRGTGLCLTGECENGLSVLRHAITLQPGNAALQLNLCSVLVWNEMYETGLPECTAAIQTGDAAVLAQAYYLRSQAYKALGNAASAAADLIQARKLKFNEAQDVLEIVEPGSIPPGVLE